MLKIPTRHLILVNGLLWSAIRKELDEVFALSCIYTYSTPGITNVTIR